jgi:translation initiation factor 1A
MAKKGGKKGGKSNHGKGETIKRPLTLAEETEKYAKVINALGDRRMKLVLVDGSEMVGHIPGRLRKVWIKSGDVVLVSHREFQPSKLDILHKYTPEEARRLYKEDEIPKFFIQVDAIHTQEEEDIGFDFEDEDNFNEHVTVEAKPVVDIDEL